MPEVIVALYDSYGAAAHARTDLVAEGFPTDRVELTARIDEGRAGAVPGEVFEQRAARYFGTLFDVADSRRYADFFTEGLKRGGATITVHPRDDEEIERAGEILQRHRPIDIEGRDPGKHAGACVARTGEPARGA